VTTRVLPGERALPEQEAEREEHFVMTANERDQTACDRLLMLLIKHHPEHEQPVKRARH
jgi:hypothetical protein